MLPTRIDIRIGHLTEYRCDVGYWVNSTHEKRLDIECKEELSESDELTGRWEYGHVSCESKKYIYIIRHKRYYQYIKLLLL